MNEFDKLVADLDGQADTMSANTALVYDGVQNPNVQGPATAKAVTMVDHPGQYVKTFEAMGRVEQMGYSLKAGWHNTVMANKMADVVDAAENAITGASSTMVDETSYDVQDMLNGDNDVSNAIGEQLTQEAFTQARQYGELVAESEQYQPPREIQEMAKQVEGMDLGEGLWEGLKTLWQGDMLGNSIYLFGSSLSAIAPELAASTIGGGALGFATRAPRLVNAVRTAVMGLGSSRVEYGSTIADQLQKRGVNLQDAQGLVEKLSDEATLADIKSNAARRSVVVGGFDALAAGLATAKLSPGNFLRNSSKVTAQASQSVGRRIASEVGNVATQATVQGALGGAGEAFGSLAAGDEINPGDVLLEMLGEFTTAPVDVGTAVASESFAYVKGKAQAAESLETEKVLNNVSNAVEAIRNDLGNDEAVQAWASRVGQDQTLFSFAQDLIDNGSLEKIREINPELATQIETAAEEHQTVEIPVSKMMTIAARDKSLADEIIKDSRTHVDGMTPREAEEFLKNGKDDAMKLFDKIIKRSNSDIQRHKEARQITQGIADQLVQAGTRKDVAEMQVKPWEAYLVNRSKALGMKPQELANLIHLQVKADGGVSGTVPNSFASPMTQGKYWKMGSHVLGMEKENVKVIHAAPIDQSDRKQAIDKLESILKKGVSNTDTRWILTGSRSDAKKSLPPFKFKKEVNGLYDAIVNSFESIASNAKLIESHRDVSHNNSSVQGIHIFANAVSYQGQVYRVQLTVRDYIGGGNESRLATHSIDAVEISVVDDGTGATAPRAPAATVINQSDTSQSSGAGLSNAQPSSDEISLSKLLNGYNREDGAGAFDPVDESAYSEGGVYYSPEDSFNQSAWHGSPHVFDRFSTDNIGTGEGAQVHGWGLYFAKSQSVADSYRETLLKVHGKDNRRLIYKGVVSDDHTGKLKIALKALEAHNISPLTDIKAEYDSLVYMYNERFQNADRIAHLYEGLIDQIDRNPKMSISGFLKIVPDGEHNRIQYAVDTARKNAKAESRRASIKDVQAALQDSFVSFDKYRKENKEPLDGLKEIDLKDLVIEPKGGRVFEVEIPDEKEMLDENLLWGAGSNFELRNKIRNMIRDWNIANPDNPIYKWPDRPTGKDIYKAVAEVMGGPKEASLWFNERGIKGITYEGVRDGRCYVVFDDKSIDVLNFYQTNRGSYTPGPNLITLMENADKSTFLHESAHAWLDADTMLADSIADKFLAGQELSEGELSLLRNIGGFFRWGQREGVLDLKVRNNDTSIANAIKVWRSMSVQEQTGMHELFAQGFESYLIEGTAPNLEMRTLFQRFAQWLKDVYAHAVNAPKPLSKEVSKLYDLLFISEQEARDAETRAGLMALFEQDDKNINMTAEERKEYDRLNEDAKLEAEGIIRKSVAGVIRTYANIRRQVANRIRIDHKKRVDEVEKQLMLESRHMVREALTKDRDWGHNHRPYRYQFDEKILRDEGYDQETINALKKKGFVYQHGQRMRAQLIGVKGMAALFGHPEPVRLVRELLDIEPAREEATKMVAAEIQMQTGQTFETYSQLQPDVAAHNRTRSRFLNAEFNALARMLGQKSMIGEAAREYATNKIDEMNVSDVLPYVYVQNEKRCAKMAEKFYRQGKFDHCLEAKRGQIVNFEMARAALSLREEFEKTVRRTKRAVKSKTLYKPYQSILIAIAQAHDIADRPGKANPLGNDKIKEILNELEAEGTPIDGIEAVLADHTKYKDMTVKQARDLFAILRELEAIARNRETSNLLQEKQRIATIVEEGQQRLDVAAKEQKREPIKHMEVPKTPWDKTKDLLERFFVGHVKIATYCRIFDRNQDNGFFWNLFIRSANERANFENAQREQLTQQLADILIPVFGRKGMFTQDKIRIGDRIMSKGERFAAALNMGNESNLKRLINGDPEQWTDENIKALQQSLTTEDWQAVQKVWDLFESLRPMIAEKQMRVYGEEPLWIEPLPQTIQAANGQIDLQGGYYPVVYDPRASNRADRQNDVAQTAQAMRGAFQSATTARSFTKQRVEDPDVGPLRLDMTGLYNGLNDVIHDLAWHEWLIETRRVLNGVNGDNTGLRQKIKELYGYHVAKAFEQWREGIAQGDRVPSDSFGKPILRALAGNVGVASMGFSAMSAVVQLTGIGYAIPRCGAMNVMAALTTFITHPCNARQTINALSPMMRSRARTMNRQIAEIKNRLEAGHVNPLQRYAYSMLIAVQSVVDSITWLASYRKAMKMQSVINSTNPDATAAAIADQGVIDTQSSGNINDLSAVERSDILEPFTVFYSFMNTAMNQAYAIYKGEENRRAAYTKLIFMGVVMPVAEKLIREALTADDGSDDDDDLDEKIQSLLLTTAGAVTEYHLGMFVGLRELSSIVGDSVAGEHAFNYGGPAGTRGIGAMATLVQRVNDPFSSGFVNAAVDVGGALLGLPSTQIKKVIKGIRAIENEDVEGIDAMKAPIFGYSGQVK